MKRIIGAALIIAALLLAGCASTGGAPREPVTYRLRAEDAVLTTNDTLVLETSYDGPPNVGWWSFVTDQISWDLEVEYSCDYVVLLNVACDPEFPGSTVAINVAGQTLEAQIPDTGDWANYTLLEAGVVTLEAGTYTVLVNATDVPTRFVCNLRDVRLTTQ
jgi:hypothetical protein